jgi:transcriptional regulator NrdR family protein
MKILKLQSPLICNCEVKPDCIDSRQYSTHRARRYRCPECDRRWSTVEIIAGDCSQQGCNTLVPSATRMLEVEGRSELKKKLTDVVEQMKVIINES